MEEGRSVKLHGMWASPYVMRARLALKIKGIEYEYMEENLMNKSELLSQYNPVYKKVPLLVHNGFPIAESLVILEYIDETWTHPPHLFPKDPTQRAKLGFWATFFQNLLKLIRKTVITDSETHQKAIFAVQQNLEVAEKEVKQLFPNGVSDLKQKVKPDYLDIVFYSVFCNQDAADKFFGSSLLAQEKYPFLVSWIEALKEVQEVKDVTPPTDKMLEFLYRMHDRHFQPHKA